MEVVEFYPISFQPQKMEVVALTYMHIIVQIHVQ